MPPLRRPDRPRWQLPQGVTRGLWDYTHTDAVADDYDDYFAANRLFDFDQQVLARVCRRREGAVVADLGCGTGRALVPLTQRGLRGLAIDLSERMLQNVRRKVRDQQLPIHCLQANLVELDGVADDAVDYAISMFSTLGMIQGRANRQQALRHVRRILKPDGRFVLHAHNYWYNLYDPGGPWWVLRTYTRALLLRDIEAGDKYFHYRGVANMFLHVFRRRELLRDLRQAGFTPLEIIPLHPRRHRQLPLPWLFGSLRANGWIVVCR